MNNKIEAMFKKVMNETACDMAELLFRSEAEKKNYINSAWDDYGDCIEEHIFGAVDDGFDGLNEEKQTELMIQAIKDNAESIFDMSFNE